MKEWRIKRKLEISFYVISFCLSSVTLHAQNYTRIMFYNVENLFDTIDDSLKLDDEFLLGNERNWSNFRLNTKLKRIYQVIIAASNESLPAVIGLAEVENALVLTELLTKTPLERMGYRFIHQESPDRRGIDVALLYQHDQFKPTSYEAIPVIDTENKSFKTRDILHVEGIVFNDTLHIFVNHWPSKYGGVLESIPKRKLAAAALKNSILKVLELNPEANIIIMGDFNDSPFDESLQVLLNDSEFPVENQLQHMGFALAQKGRGSNKYHGKWDLIDQIIISECLTDSTGLTTNANYFQIFAPEFLLEADEKYLGEKPKRTYIGFKYNDGFSDHLPVILDLQLP